jgi:hypothetical protein
VRKDGCCDGSFETAVQSAIENPRQFERTAIQSALLIWVGDTIVMSLSTSLRRAP